MKTKTLAIGGLVAAGGGALLVGRLTGSRWAGRVVGDGYRPTGAAARAFFAGGGLPPADARIAGTPSRSTSRPRRSPPTTSFRARSPGWPIGSRCA